MEAQLGPIAAWQRWWCDRWFGCNADSLSELARGQGFVLTSAQARELGWMANELRRELRRQRLFSPARGVVSPIVPDGAGGPDAARHRATLMATGAVLLRPGQIASGRSAAVMQGLPVFRVPDRPQVTARHAQTLGKRPRTHVYSAGIAEREITSWYGAALTTASRTLVDLGRHDRRDAIMAADAALRECIVTRNDIDDALTRAIGATSRRRAGARRSTGRVAARVSGPARPTR